MRSIGRITALLECKTQVELLESIFQLGNDYGFEHILFALAPNIPTSLGDVFIRTNFPAEWLTTYEQNDLINIDPTVVHCITSSAPLVWNPRIFRSSKQVEMLNAASRCGLRAGITLPFHGVNGVIGALCFAKNTRTRPQDILAVSPNLSLLRDCAFQAALKFVKLHNPKPATPLSQCEMACLKWCATGKNTWEISQILNCSEHTVNFHFLNLRRKLNASSRWHAVVKAIHLGLLHSPYHKNASKKSVEELAR